MSAESKRFTAFINKRTYNFNYLSRAHIGDETAPHFLNIYLLCPDDFRQCSFKASPQILAVTLALGSSLLIQEPDIYVDSILAALEYHEATEVTQDPIKIAEILSEKLKGIEADIPEVPDLNNGIISLDYRESIFAFCETLEAVYKKLANTPENLVGDKAFLTKILRIDEIINKILLTKLSSDVQNLCAAKIQQSLYSIDSIYALNKMRHF